jgi:thiamine-phosphate diphosphorylase
VPLVRTRGVIAVVTDRRRLSAGASGDARDALVCQAVAASQAGADMFQIRERDLAARDLFELVVAVMHAVEGSAMKVLVNDRLDIAMAARAHGVQLPSAGLSASDVRTIAPEGFLLGHSVHGTDPVDPRADFAVFGTVFPTASKGPDHVFAGVTALDEAVRHSTVPVLAIGGITEATVAEVAAVCDGVAAIGWFARTDPQEMADAIRRARTAFDTATPLI